MKELTTYGEPIKCWKPHHDRMVALHLAGMNNIEIGNILGFTQNHVKRVLRDPRAQKAIELARRRILGRTMVSIRERMVNLGSTAIERIAETIEADFEHGTKAKMHQDTVSFELLARIGFGKKEEEKDRGGIRLSRDAEERLVSAIEKSDRRREIHDNAEEVDATVVGEEPGPSGNGRELD